MRKPRLKQGEKQDMRAMLFSLTGDMPLQKRSSQSPLPFWFGVNLFGYLQPFRV